MILKSLKFICVGFFRFTPLNFHHLIAETASPGPEVSVPTLGSWKYDDLICKIPKNPKHHFFLKHVSLKFGCPGSQRVLKAPGGP